MSKPPVFVLKTGGFGPSGETRTRGILVPNQAPYQLGHTRITAQHYISFPRKKQLEFRENCVLTRRFFSDMPRGRAQNAAGKPG